MINSLCLFCGSARGIRNEYSEAADRLAAVMLRLNIGLVYGGANIGLMGAAADAMLKGGGRVIGVIPQSIVEREVAHQGLTELHIVGGMQERKAMMADLSDAFIALPGGYGTLDELFEVLTWNQLGIVKKPIGLLNAAGFFDPLLAMLDHAVEERFLRPEHRAMLLCHDDPEELIRQLDGFRPVTAEKWIERLKAGSI